VVHTLKAGYRAGAVWMMATLTLAAVRKLKDTTNRYLWEPSLQAGVPSNLLGYAVIENEDMPAIGAGANAIAFGNFKRGYKIVDLVGTRVLRDPYTNKPYTSFYTTKRLGGGVEDSNAIIVHQLT
jgi:HK97 family phage major capsid protein